MEPWLITLIFAGATALVSLIIKDVYVFIKKSSKKAIEKEKEKRKEALREVLQESWGPLQKNIDLLMEGTKAMLRNSLLENYRSCRRRGYRTKEDCENFLDMYEVYISLGGNSFIQHNVKMWFDEIPTESIYKNDQKVKGD